MAVYGAEVTGGRFAPEAAAQACYSVFQNRTVPSITLGPCFDIAAAGSSIIATPTIGHKVIRQ